MVHLPSTRAARMRYCAAFLVLLPGSVVASILLWILFTAITDPPRVKVDIARIEAQRLFEADPATGFRPRPGVHMADIAGESRFDIFTDLRGGRSPAPAGRRLDRADILTVGDSQAWGHGVQNEETFSSIVATATGMKAGNLSVISYGGPSALERLRANMDLRPRIVIYGMWEHHLDRNVNGCAENGSPVCMQRPFVKLTRDDAQLVMPADPSGSYMEATRQWYLQTTTATDTYRSTFTDVRWSARRLWQQLSERVRPEVSDDDKVRAAEFVIDHMHRTTRDAGAHLVVVFIPIYFGQIIRDVPAGLAAAFEGKKAFTFVSMTTRFRAMRNAGTPLWIDGDGHMSKAAHQAVAEEIVRAIRVHNPSN